MYMVYTNHMFQAYDLIICRKTSWRVIKFKLISVNIELKVDMCQRTRISTFSKPLHSLIILAKSALGISH